MCLEPETYLAFFQFSGHIEGKNCQLDYFYKGWFIWSNFQIRLLLKFKIVTDTIQHFYEASKKMRIV